MRKNLRPFLFRSCLVLGLAAANPLPAQQSRSQGGASTGGRQGGQGRRQSEANSTPHSDRPKTPEAPEPDELPEPELAIVAKFDTNGDHRLDATERKAARAYLATLTRHAPPNRPGGAADRPKPIALEPAKPGIKISPAKVATCADQSLYDPTIVRTVFLAFEDKDWEQQLTDFAGTDVQLPVRVTIDGHTYEGVGARFAPRERLDPDEPGYKRTLLLSFDFIDPAQRIAGQRQLILVDDHRDPTGLRTALYLDVARSQVFAPWANFVQVAINGENWGIYTNQQPFDERFTVQQFGSEAGARWIVPSAGGLTYLGDDPAPYRAIYRLQTPEDPAAWTALIKLCRTLAQTPVDQLAAALADQLEVDSTVKFLALETALINQDGYRTRGGGYGLYLAPSGRFQLVPLAAESSLRLVEKADFSREGGGGLGWRESESAIGTNGAMPEAVQRELNARKAAPHKAQTDLAMLLSNSFINKADRNDDRKVTIEEWLGFAQGWFSVLDENFTGSITRDRFIAGFRLFVSPPSVLDGRTHQTFGKDDPAAVLGGELFSDIDRDQDSNATRAEFIDAFTRWHAAWSEADPKAKAKVLTEEGVNRGLNSLLGGMVFSADQSYIATKQGRGAFAGDMSEESGGRGGGGRRGGGDGNASANASIGIPGLNLGLGSRNGRGGSIGRSVVVLREELDVFAGLDDARRPLLSKLLAVPELRMRYFACIHDLAENWLTWEKLGAQAQVDHQLILPFVKEETRRAAGYARFVQEFDQDGAEVQSDSEPSLKKFLSARRTYLLENESPDAR